MSNTSKSASLSSTIRNEQYHFVSSFDWFQVPIRSAVKSNLTIWCCQNLSKHALNALTVQVSMTELGKYLQCVNFDCQLTQCYHHDNGGHMSLQPIGVLEDGLVN